MSFEDVGDGVHSAGGSYCARGHNDWNTGGDVDRNLTYGAMRDDSAPSSGPMSAECDEILTRAAATSSESFASSKTAALSKDELAKREALYASMVMRAFNTGKIPRIVFDKPVRLKTLSPDPLTVADGTRMLHASCCVLRAVLQHNKPVLYIPIRRKVIIKVMALLSMYVRRSGFY